MLSTPGGYKVFFSPCRNYYIFNICYGVKFHHLREPSNHIHVTRPGLRGPEALGNYRVGAPNLPEIYIGTLLF